MVPRGLKSIFIRKIKISIFRPKMLEVKHRFLVKKSKFNFLIKICPKMVPRGLKSIFGRKLTISNFWPKIYPGGQKLIFDQKNENAIFRSKFAQKRCLEVSNWFLVEKKSIFRPNMDHGGRNRFLVKKSKVQIFDQNMPKNRA